MNQKMGNWKGGLVFLFKKENESFSSSLSVKFAINFITPVSAS